MKIAFMFLVTVILVMAFMGCGGGKQQLFIHQVDANENGIIDEMDIPILKAKADDYFKVRIQPFLSKAEVKLGEDGESIYISENNENKLKRSLTVFEWEQLMERLSNYNNIISLIDAIKQELIAEKAKHEQRQAKVLVFADRMYIAEKVVKYMESEADFILTPTSDVQMLNAQNIVNYHVVILVPLGGVTFSPLIASAIKNFVEDGGGIIGIHDILFKQNRIFYEFFGGGAGVFPVDAMEGKIAIRVRDPDHMVVRGIPSSFVLVSEHPTKTWYKPNVHRILEMSYKKINGKTEEFCAGWLYSYRKGKAFFFAPGDTEETRYNPYFIQLLSNAVLWMQQDKN